MDYKIIYSARRTLAIQVTKACEVVVRAPKGISKDKIEAFVARSKAWIDTHVARQVAFNEAHPIESDAELEALRAKALAVLPKRVEYFSKIMGVTPTKVSINKATTRYGSCSSSGRINFSCRVMRFSDEAIDYVVVHELAHLKHLNHSAKFWAFVGKFIPDYKERKRLLKA